MDTSLPSEFWTDPRIEALDAAGKLAALWLMSNPSRDLLGFTKASRRRFEFETGLPAETLEGVCKALPSTFQAPSDGVWFAAKFLRRQFGKGGNISLENKVIRSAIRSAKTLPSPLQGAFLNAYPELRSSVLEPSRDGRGIEGASKPPPSPHSIAEHSKAPFPVEEAKDLVTERAETAGEIGRRIMALRPEWGKPASLTGAELHELHANLAAFQSLDPDDWTRLEAYLGATLPQGAGYWQPARRSQLIGAIADVISHALRWHSKSRQPRRATTPASPGLK